MVYFQGQCQASDSLAQCSIPGYTAELTNMGNNYPPKAETLTVCTTGAGSKSCNSYNFNGAMNPNKIIKDALSDMSKWDTLAYREVLYDMLLFYGGSCDVTTNSRSMVTSCSMPGSYATLHGDTSPSPALLHKCTLMTGGNTNCQDYSFDQRSPTRAILSEAFPTLNNS